MSIYTTFHVIYGFRLPHDLKHKEMGEDFSRYDLEDELEERDGDHSFQLLWDQMGCAQDTIFGQGLCYMDGNVAEIKKADISNLQTDRVKQLYDELFKDYDAPLDVEPQLFCIVHQS